MLKNGMIAVLLSLAALAGCGGSGSSKQQAPPTQAVVTLSTAGAADIEGAQAVLHLPAGVTVAANATSGKTDGGVVTAAGDAAAGSPIAVGHFTPAGSTVKVVVVKTARFGAGPFAKVTCNLAPGTSPTAADFSLSDLKAVDSNGAALAGVTGTLTVVLR